MGWAGEKKSRIPAHTLHLLAAGVARGHEGLLQLRKVVVTVQTQQLAGLVQQLGGHGPLQKALHGTHHGAAAAAEQRLKNAQPLVLPLVGDHGGVVEGERPGGEERDLLPQQGGEVGGHALGVGLVGADHHHAAPGLPAHSGGEVGPVHAGQPAHRRGTGARVDGGEQGLKFRDLADQGCQFLHGIHLTVFLHTQRFS